MARLNFFKICLPLFLVLFTDITAVSQPNHLKVVKDNIACLYGLKDQNGIWVVEAEYLNITQRDKVFLVQQGEKYGVLDHKGKVILPVKYDRIQWNTYGTPRNYIVSLNKRTGIIHRNGKIIIPFIYDNIETKDHNMFFTRLDQKMGYADTSGNFIPPVYDKLELFENGVFRAGRIENIKNNYSLTYGLINNKNDTIVPFKYQYIWKNSSRGGLLLQKDGAYCLLSSAKDTLIPEGTIIRGFDHSYPGISKDHILIAKQNKKWGLMTGDGKWITEQIYDQIEEFTDLSNGVPQIGWKITLNKKTGILEGDGTVFLEPMYDDIQLLRAVYDNRRTRESSYLYYLEVKLNNKTGILDTDKNIFLDTVFTAVKYSNNRYYYSTKDTICYFELYSEINSIPQVKHLRKFGRVKDDLFLFRDQEKFVFCRMRSQKGISWLEPLESSYHDQRVRKIAGLYEVIYERDTVCLDLNGKQIEHPFRGQIIEKEIYGNLILKNKKNWYTYCDSSGKNLFDTLYRNIVWEEPFLWVQTEKGKSCPAGRSNNYWDNCNCGWQRFDANARRLDKIIYDFPIKFDQYQELVFINGKAALFNSASNRLMIDPLYLDLVSVPGGNLYFGVCSDSTFVVLTNTGKKISNEVFSSYIPLVRRNSAFTSRKNAKMGHLYFLLQNEKGKILMDEKGKIIKKEKLVAQTILQSIELTVKDKPYQFPYNPNLKYSGPYVNASHKTELNDDLEKALLWFMHYLLTEHRGRYTAFPGNGTFYSLCNGFNMAHTHPSVNESWYFQYFSKEAFTVGIGNNIFSADYHRNQYYHNFVRTENGYKKITLNDLFKDGVSVSQLLNELIVTDIAQRDDLNIDCSNPNSFFKMTNGEFGFSDKGMVLHVRAHPEFRSVIPWKSLLPYAKPGGTIEFFANEKK